MIAPMHRSASKPGHLSALERNNPFPVPMRMRLPDQATIVETTLNSHIPPPIEPSASYLGRHQFDILRTQHGSRSIRRRACRTFCPTSADTSLERLSSLWLSYSAQVFMNV